MLKMVIRGAIALLSVVSIVGVAHAGEFSPYLPAPGGGNLDFNYIHQESPVLRKGIGGKTPVRPWQQLTQNTYLLSGSYGVTDRFAIDARIGFSETDFQRLNSTIIQGTDGVSDTLIGIRYRVFDELENAPVTVTFGASGIIQGLYAPTVIDSIGEGASGAQVGVSIGKLVTPKLALTAEIGGRFRFDTVPEEIFFSLGASYSVNSRVGIFASINHADSLGGVDVGGVGFRPGGFQNVEEDNNYADFGGSVRLWKGLSLTGSYGRRFLGKNTLQGGFFRTGLSYSF